MYCSLLTDKVCSKFVTNFCGAARSNIDYIICIFKSHYSQSVLEIVPVPYMDKIVEYPTRFDYYSAVARSNHVTRAGHPLLKRGGLVAGNPPVWHGKGGLPAGG